MHRLRAIISVIYADDISVVAYSMTCIYWLTVTYSIYSYVHIYMSYIQMGCLGDSESVRITVVRTVISHVYDVHRCKRIQILKILIYIVT